MKYNFDIWASHENNGNMKGSWAKNMPADGIMLSSAEMDYPLPEFITGAVSVFAANGLFGFTLSDRDYKGAICTTKKLNTSLWTMPCCGQTGAKNTAQVAAAL